MATKKKILHVKIKPQYCKAELENVLNSIGTLKYSDPEKGIYVCIYKYVFQSVQVKVALKPNKGLSSILIQGTTDDLIGTGAKKAIAKIETGITELESQYEIDYEIDKAYLEVTRDVFDSSFELFHRAKRIRDKEFKVHHGLTLWYVHKNNYAEAEIHFKQALKLLPPAKRISFRTKTAIALFKGKHFHLADKIFKPVYEEDKTTLKNIQLHLLLRLSSGNMSEVLKLLIIHFKSHPGLPLSLLQEKSLSADKKNLLRKNIPFLIGLIRNNISIDLHPGSLEYLIKYEITNEGISYQKAALSFSNKKEKSYPAFVQNFEKLLQAGKVLDKKAKEVLREQQKDMLSSFKKNIQYISIIQQKDFKFVSSKRTEEFSSKINSSLDDLSASVNFNSFFNSIKRCEVLEKDLEKFITDFRELLIKELELQLTRKNSKEAKELLDAHYEIFKTLPKKRREYNDRLNALQQEEALKKQQTKRIVFQVAAAILVVAFGIYGINDLMASGESVVETVENVREEPSQEKVSNTPSLVIEEVPERGPHDDFWAEIAKQKEDLILDLNQTRQEPNSIMDFLNRYRSLVLEINDHFQYDDDYLYSEDFSSQVAETGFEIAMSEGTNYVTMSPDLLRYVADNTENHSGRNYLLLVANEIEEKCCDDAAIMISDEELISRCINWGEFYLAYQETPYMLDARDYLKTYLRFTLEGIDNTPSFDYQTGRFRTELLQAMDTTISEFPNSLAAMEFRHYKKLLQLSNFERTGEVSRYLDLFRDMEFDLSSENFYSRFRDYDFNILTPETKIIRLLEAEDERDFYRIASFYSGDMHQYWQVQNPSLSDIKKQYEATWQFLNYSKNTILTIQRIDQNTFSADIKFEFEDPKTKEIEVRYSSVKYVFSESGLIDEITAI